MLLAVVGTVLFLLDRQAATAVEVDTLQQVVRTADDVGDPPAGVLLVLRAPNGRVRGSTGTPPVVVRGALLDRPDGLLTWHAPNGTSYRVLTAARPGGQRLQALLDTRREVQERDRLLAALLLGGAC